MRRELLIAAILLAACDDKIPGACKVAADCWEYIPEATCRDGICIRPQDAGTGDGAVPADDGGAPPAPADGGGDARVQEDAGTGDGAAVAADGGAAPAPIDGGGHAGVQDAASVAKHTVTAVAGAGGSINPASATVVDGAATSFTVTAGAGYLANASGCGGSLSGSTYTTGAITADCAVTATFISAATSLSLSPRGVKTFHFNWGNVAGAARYVLLEDPDGASGYTPIANIEGATSYDLVVSLPKRIKARYLLRACNAGGCADSATAAVSGDLVSAVGYVKASNTGAGDQFGNAVALSSDGNTLAVGAPYEGSNATGAGGDQVAQADDSAWGSGAVYVFTRNGGTWTQQAYVKASNTGGRFGGAVALSSDGSTLAVGAVGESSSAKGINGSQSDQSAGASGAVYVFTRSSGIWTQQAYVKASNTAEGDNFGRAVALSSEGDTLAVGADSQAAFSGAVYVFTRSSGTWTQQAFLKASNADASDAFGGAVALSSDGNTLAVGARFESSNARGVGGDQSDNSGKWSGAVYVFTRSGGTWTQQVYLKASNVAAFFGAAVSLSSDGNTLAVGATGECSNAKGIDGGQSDISAQLSGAAYIFKRSGGTWSQQTYVKASNTDAKDAFGRVVLSSDGNTLVVGAIGESSSAKVIDGNQLDNSVAGSGAVYLFKRNGATWSQQAYIKASNTGADDSFGTALALSSDGSTLVVGALHEDSNAAGIGGDQRNDSAGDSGAVYLY